MAIICMKRVFREVNLHQTYEAHFIAEKMATLLTSDKLGVWEREMGAYVFSDDFENPQEIIAYLQELNNDFKNKSIIDDRLGYYKNIHLEVLDEAFYQSLIDFYRNMDDETKETIGLCQTVAGGNLYCGYCEKFTNEALIELLNRTDMWRNFDFYKIAKFYPFSCDDKWGKKFKFNNFKRK